MSHAVIRPLTILCDVDGVVANLHAEWLARYNDDYDDNLTPDDITTWSITDVVKPECGKRIFGYLQDPQLYEWVDPMPGAIEGVQALRNAGHRVVFVTSCVDGTIDQKVKWLRHYGLLPEGRAPGRDFIAANDKGLIDGDIFIDDAWHNLKDTKAHPVIFNAPYNCQHQDGWRDDAVRVCDWGEIKRHVFEVARVGEGGSYKALEYDPSIEFRRTSPTGGEKGEKLARFDLIPTGPLWQVAEHYGVGAKKYEDRNWERGYPWSLSYAAMQRHLNQFWGGESLDAETGSSHLAAVVFHAFALMEYVQTHPEYDDRPSSKQEEAA